MNELIKVTTNEKDEQVVSGRELHEYLGVETRYDKWIARKIKTYKFLEGTDFVLVGQKRPTNNPKNPTTEYINHALTINMAKALAMVANTDKGHQTRLYFIQVEEEYLKQLKVAAGLKKHSVSEAFRSNNEIASQLVSYGLPRNQVMRAVLKRTEAMTGEDLSVFLDLLTDMPERLTEAQAVNNYEEPWNEF